MAKTTTCRYLYAKMKKRVFLLKISQAIPAIGTQAVCRRILNTIQHKCARVVRGLRYSPKALANPSLFWLSKDSPLRSDMSTSLRPPFESTAWYPAQRCSVSSAIFLSVALQCRSFQSCQRTHGFSAGNKTRYSTSWFQFARKAANGCIAVIRCA